MTDTPRDWEVWSNGKRVLGDLTEAEALERADRAKRQGLDGEARPARAPIDREQTSIDYETGLIHVPGQGELPMIGPTSGGAAEAVKDLQGDHLRSMRRIERVLLSTYQCTQCKLKQPGTAVRLKRVETSGMIVEMLVCQRLKCDAPVVMIEDVMDLRIIPGARG